MKNVVFAALGAAFFFGAGAAAAQPAPGPSCAPRAQIAQALALQFGERLLVQAPMDDGRLLEIYVAPDRGSWTAVAIAPLSGIACVLGSGSAFELIVPGRTA